ncbi:MAG TPA: TetR/AcrR family transcriptional regulator [Methyloceanibacter sp.]|nr:TetR/AcrR family transcriptional regulator [Methyloceanibacter sp.]
MGRPRAFDMDQALDQALHVFWQKGYEGASICDLTAAMGINPPSLYAAFGNKETLFREALDRYEAIRDQIMAEAFAAPTAREAIQRLLEGTADRLSDKRNPTGCLLSSGSARGRGMRSDQAGSRRAARGGRGAHPRAPEARQAGRGSAGRRGPCDARPLREHDHAGRAAAPAARSCAPLPTRR